MGYLLYLMYRCDRRCDGCDGKFGNLVGTKHTHWWVNWEKGVMSAKFYLGLMCWTLCLVDKKWFQNLKEHFSSLQKRRYNIFANILFQNIYIVPKLFQGTIITDDEITKGMSGVVLNLTPQNLAKNLIANLPTTGCPNICKKITMVSKWVENLAKT